jgi:hypothetical protein
MCASCVDEFSGKLLINKDKIEFFNNFSKDVFPHKIEAKGNYAVYIAWS